MSNPKQVPPYPVLPPRELKATLRQIDRVRALCTTMPEATERLSHGEPTWFVRKRVFTMFSNNHHGDGRVAIVVPFDPGLQPLLIQSEPAKYYYPPYVGVNGWLGILLNRVSERDLREHILEAWRRVAPKKLLQTFDAS